MNRDTMSRTQLIALVKELEAQNAELHERSGENVRANYFKAVSEEIEQIEQLLSYGGDLSVTRVAQPRDGWITWGEIAAQHGSSTDEAISELRQGLDRIFEEMRELRRDIEAARPRCA